MTKRSQSNLEVPVQDDLVFDTNALMENSNIKNYERVNFFGHPVCPVCQES